MQKTRRFCYDKEKYIKKICCNSCGNNDAFGYLVNHVASCAGSTRTTGLCLNMLGINYEHVNENQWTHQWCRADLDGIVWVVDPYAYTCMPEEYPYWHPLAEF